MADAILLAPLQTPYARYRRRWSGMASPCWADDKSRKIFPGPSPVQKILRNHDRPQGSEMHPPQEKIDIIIQTILPVLSHPRTSIRKAMSLLGLLIAAIPTVPWAQIHSRPRQLQILQVWDRSNISLDQEFHLSENVLVSLQWWMHRGSIFPRSVGGRYKEKILKLQRTVCHFQSPSGDKGHTK